MHAVTEFQARVIIVAERDRLDGYRVCARACVHEVNKEGKKLCVMRNQELSNGRVGQNSRGKLAELFDY